MVEYKIETNKGEKASGFLTNAFSLYCFQFLQFLTPLITLPILATRLGAEAFGLLMFWGALGGTLAILVDYGFNVSSVRLVANQDWGRKQLGELFSSTFVARLVLFVIAVIVLFSVALIVPKSKEDTLLGSIFLIQVFSVAVSPVWLYVGLKRNAVIAKASVLSQCLMVAGIYLCVRSSEDIYLAALIQCLSGLLLSLVLLLFVWRTLGIEIVLPSLVGIAQRLREGWAYFVTSICAGMYTSLNPFLLGLVTSSEQVAYFSLGEKLIRAGRGVFAPVMTALFPYSTRYGRWKWDRYTQLVTLVCIASLALPVVVVWFASELVMIFGGTEFVQAEPVVKVLAFSLFFITLGNIAGIQTLAAKGHDRVLVWVTACVAILYLVAFPLIALCYQAIGGAWVYLVAEAVVALSFVVIAVKIGRKV